MDKETPVGKILDKKHQDQKKVETTTIHATIPLDVKIWFKVEAAKLNMSMTGYVTRILTSIHEKHQRQ